MDGLMRTLNGRFIRAKLEEPDSEPLQHEDGPEAEGTLQMLPAPVPSEVMRARS